MVPGIVRLSFLGFAAVSLAACATNSGETGAKPEVEKITINWDQKPVRIYHDVYGKATPDNTSLSVNLTEQRAYFYAGDEIAIDTPITSGSEAGPTPLGNYNILEKKSYHLSSVYGRYVDAGGDTVRDNTTSRSKAPSGTVFKGTPMPYWQRLTWDGLGTHVGIVPGYPASHGCVRFPSKVQQLIYRKTKIGTPVEIVN